MQISDLTKLGKIIKAHGFNGAVVIALEKDFREEILKLESVFVGIDGLPVPFFIGECRESGKNTVIIKFDYYDSDKMVEELIGCELFSEEDYSSFAEDSNLPLSYIGFSILDGEGNIVGRIMKVLSYPMQTMFELETVDGNSSSILIPFNDDWVIELSQSEKFIKMQLPEGLASVNP